MKKYRIIFITSGEFVEFNEEDTAGWNTEYEGLDLMIRTACYVFYFDKPYCSDRDCNKCPWIVDTSDRYDPLEYLLEEIK